MFKRKKKEDLEQPLTLQKGNLLDYGTFIGKPELTDLSSKDFLSVFFIYYLSNNYFDRILKSCFLTLLVTLGFIALYTEFGTAETVKSSTLVQLLGEYGILKLSVGLSTLIQAFVIGYFQYDFLVKVKAPIFYFIGFIIVTYFLLFGMNFFLIYVCSHGTDFDNFK